jgi:hypothetical protein
MQTVKIVAAVFLSGWMVACGVGGTGDAHPQNDLKIVPPPGGGMYLGQNELTGADVETIEEAIGRRMAIVADESMVYAEGEEGNVTVDFDVDAAESAWQRGQVVVVHGLDFGTVPETGEPTGYIIDRMLMGDYDEELSRLAAKYRQFGKPMFFAIAREPNGLGSSFQGGFGPDGDKSMAWAGENNQMTNQFDPSKFPNPELYAGLGDPVACDGLERLAAAQRYYYDFFVRREGLSFLTFDSMGWAVDIYLEPLVSEPGSCFDFNVAYPGDDYVDWFSVTWYPGIGGEEGEDLPIQRNLDSLANMVHKFGQLASHKPIFIMEFGVGGGPGNAPAVAAQNITDVLQGLIAAPGIDGFTLWGWDFSIVPNTPRAEAFKAVMDAHPDQFHSCVYFSDGSRMPNCNSSSMTK